MTSSQQLDTRQPAAIFRSLDASGRISLCADACLELRPASSACGHCRDVCPAKAFEWGAEDVSLNTNCTGCGQCGAACPTGAIRAAGFDLEKLQSPSHRIECRRVPDQLAGDAARVPCLGGLSAELLISLGAQAPASWTIIDRGWCADCPASNGEAMIAAKALEATAQLLKQMSVPKTRYPVLMAEPTPPKLARSLVPDAAGPDLSRRGFFGALVRRTAAAKTGMEMQAPVKADRGGRRPSPVIREKRLRFVTDLRQLAEESGEVLRASVFPTLEIAESCRHHEVCAAACPSGALRLYDDIVSGFAGLEFHAQDCVACGLCARLCPSGAIRLLPAGNDDVVAEPGTLTLTRHPRRVCSLCTTAFIGLDSIDQCPRCRTDRHLSASFLGTLLAEKQANKSSFDSQYPR